MLSNNRIGKISEIDPSTFWHAAEHLCNWLINQTFFQMGRSNLLSNKNGKKQS
jgi:hypothetical protein